MCNLNKALHGQKQSPRAWFYRFRKGMLSFGYSQGNSDHTLYTKWQGGKVVILLVYADNMIITGDNVHEIEKLKTGI